MVFSKKKSPVVDDLTSAIQEQNNALGLFADVVETLNRSNALLDTVVNDTYDMVEYYEMSLAREKDRRAEAEAAKVKNERVKANILALTN